MADITMTNATVGVNMFDFHDWGFDRADSAVFNNETDYSWLTASGNDVQVYGLGFDFSSPLPATGLVQRLEVDYGRGDEKSKPNP